MTVEYAVFVYWPLAYFHNAYRQILRIKDWKIRTITKKSSEHPNITAGP